MKTRHARSVAVWGLTLGLAAWPALAAPSIQTQQYRFIDGVAGASWGPVMLKAAGGAEPYTWSRISGTLPSGLTLQPGGRLEGTTSAAGVYEFTLRVTDGGGGTAQRTYRVRVHPAGVVQTPALEAQRLPFSYVQSAFEVGGADDPDECGPQRRRPQSKDEFKAMIRMYLTHFSGGETFFAQLEVPSDFERVRLFNEAIAEVRGEDPSQDFLAVFANGRLPGSSFPDDYPPVQHRAKSLKSDGSLWVRLPELAGTPGSIFGLRATHVDITHDVAVQTLMDRLAKAYDHEGTPTASVGPLNGFWVLDEAKPTPLYMPFKLPGAPGEPDDDDLVPREASRPSCVKGWNTRPDDPPRLLGGDPCDLYGDGDPAFSWLMGPKRSLPLFSPSARDKFVAYAFQKQGLVLQKLPADRAEFNEDEASIALEPHVQFVPLSNTAVWNVWKAWVYDTWFDYLERMARTIRFAQAGNPRFRGVLHFLPPGWYSFRSPAKDEVIPYQYYDAEDVLQTVTNQRLRDFPQFEKFNDVTHGTDIEQFVRSPWLEGFLHETSSPMMGRGTTDVSRAGDRSVLTSAQGKYLWNQEGAAARLVTRRNNGFYGLFARYFYFGLNTQGQHVQLSDPDWRWNWDRLMPLNTPDYVATLPPHHYLTHDDIDPQYACLLPSYFEGLNGPAWLNRFQALRSSYTRPAAWNPRSLGAIGTFDGRTAGGWAYDPWSTRTALTVHLVSSPNGCQAPRQIASLYADAGTSLADDTAIRNSIRATANYAPPEAMNFRYSVDLLGALQSAQAICGPGNYGLQVRVEDGQGDDLTQVLSYQGSSTLTVAVQAPTARLHWLQPQALAGFGPPGSLVIAGSATGAPAGSQVTLTWRDNSVGGPWVTEAHQPLPGSNGIWYHSIPSVNTAHHYEAYASYGGVSSPHCTYRADGGRTDCGTAASYSLIASRSGAGNGTITSAPAGIACGSDCSHVYAGGTAVALTATAAANSVFVAWDGQVDCFDGQVTLNQSLACPGRFELRGTAQARVIWLQPQALAGFGPPGSLVIAGSATGAPSGSQVTMIWRDVTAGSAWVTEAHRPVPGATGIWYHSIPSANYSHRYQVYVTYADTTSTSCTYAGSGGQTSCP